MLKGLIGKKIGMTQIFDETGVALPVTLIEAGPCYVTQVRLPEKEGYAAIQLGFGETNPKRLASGELGHLKKSDLPPLRFVREFRIKDSEYKVGDKVTVDVFGLGERVDVIGTSKGKGFAGVVKKYHFKGHFETHGTSDRVRAPGSSGSGTTPGRVYKGTRRAGHMGSERVTAQGLKVVLVDAERNLLGVHGAIPGSKGGLVLIKDARKQ
ncbi:MAG: large subunit ribosomal protein L3 [Anaerolineaceae bacterium]|nr:MAG: large subunit ribosomal protein L3 [Anaerolineaceae bacterium]